MIDLSGVGYDSRANERLERIVEFFWKGGRATASELAERFGVSRRTINHDLARLHFLEREGWTYYLPQSYLRLRPYEKAKMSGAMMLAMFGQAVPALSEYAETLFVDPPRHREIFRFDFAFEPLEDVEALATLVAIIEAGRGAEFFYTNKEGVRRRYYTFPVKIANFNGHWYLLAYDAEADRIKSFRLEALEAPKGMPEDPVDEAHKETLRRQLAGAVSSWIGPELHRVRLEVRGEAVRYFRRKRYSMLRILEDRGETLVVEASYFNEIEILRLLSKWIPWVRILDDEALREKMRRRLEEGLEAL